MTGLHNFMTRRKAEDITFAFFVEKGKADNNGKNWQWN